MTDTQKLQNIALAAIDLMKREAVMTGAIPTIDPEGIMCSHLENFPADGSELGSYQWERLDRTRAQIERSAAVSRGYAQSLRAVADSQAMMRGIADYYEANAKVCDNTIARLEEIAAASRNARGERLRLEEAMRPENLESRLAALESKMASSTR